MHRIETMRCAGIAFDGRLDCLFLAAIRVYFRPPSPPKKKKSYPCFVKKIMANNFAN